MKIVRLVFAAAFVVAVLAGCGLFPGKVLVRNNSSYTVWEVYISGIDEATWGDDLLTGFIAPGASAEFDGIAAGSYDLLAVEGGGGFWVTGDVVDEPLSVKGLRTYTWTLTNVDFIGT